MATGTLVLQISGSATAAATAPVQLRTTSANAAVVPFHSSFTWGWIYVHVLFFIKKAN